MGKLSKFQKFVRASIAEIDFVELYKSEGKRRKRDDSPPRKKVKAKKESTPRVKKEGRKKKAEGEPKGPISAAFTFMNYQPNKEACRKALGDKYEAKAAKAWMGNKWKSLSDDERKPWMDVQRADEARHKRQMEQFKKTGQFTPEERPAVKLSEPKKKDAKPPKSSEEEEEEAGEAGSYSQHDSSSE
jgi:high mobility group protein B3